MMGTEAGNRRFWSRSVAVDLLHRLESGSFCGELLSDETASVDSDEIELSLDLSLGGCFAAGNDSVKSRIPRSSSLTLISPFLYPDVENRPLSPELSPPGFLMRSASLPTEVEERRKRKEQQSLKRMELKKRRLERKSSTSGSGREIPEIDGYGGCATTEEADGLGLAVSAGTVAKPPSQHRCSSDTLQGVSAEAEAVPAAEKPALPSPTMMQDMPCVATKGVGSNGRRVEGFLYNYRQRDLRIVCVCHGSFLTPTEFVLHAGGDGNGEVTNPLKHIIVNPSPTTFR